MIKLIIFIVMFALSSYAITRILVDHGILHVAHSRVYKANRLAATMEKQELQRKSIIRIVDTEENIKFHLRKRTAHTFILYLNREKLEAKDWKVYAKKHNGDKVALAIAQKEEAEIKYYQKNIKEIMGNDTNGGGSPYLNAFKFLR